LFSDENVIEEKRKKKKNKEIDIFSEYKLDEHLKRFQNNPYGSI
jgi:hypothetical protein